MFDMINQILTPYVTERRFGLRPRFNQAFTVILDIIIINHNLVVLTCRAWLDIQLILILVLIIEQLPHARRLLERPCKRVILILADTHLSSKSRNYYFISFLGVSQIVNHCPFETDNSFQIRWAIDCCEKSSIHCSVTNIESFCTIG